MGLHSHVHCDGHTEDNPCSTDHKHATGFSVAFDQHEETWGQMLAALVEWGWRWEGGPGQRETKTYCPKHARKPHEFMPGGRHHELVDDPDCCANCGEGSAHTNHKNNDGTDYYDTDTTIDRMRFDGSVAPRMK